METEKFAQAHQNNQMEVVQLKRNFIVGLLLLTMLVGTSVVASAENIVLNWTYATNATVVSIYEQVIAEFEAENPNVTINFNPIPWDNYWEKVQTDIAGGNPPDLMFMGLSFYPIFSESGYLLDLQTYIDADDTFDLDDRFPEEKNAFATNGRVHAVSDKVNSTVLAYNKDIFDEAGLPYPTDDWTWDDLRENAIKLTERSGNRVTRYGLGVAAADYAIFSHFIEQAGGDFFTEDKSRALLDSPEALEATQFLADLILEHRVAPYPDELREMGINTRFLTGQVAMAYVNTGIRYEAESARFDWDVVRIPKHPKTGNRQTVFSSDAIAISSATEHPDVAWAFVKYLLENGANRIVETGMYLPTSVSDMEYYVEHGTGKPENREAILLSAYDMTVPPIHLRWGEMRDKVLYQEVPALFSGDLPIESGLLEINEKLNEIISQDEY